MKIIELDASRMTNKEDICSYMNQLFEFELPVTNLDALYDSLGDVSEKTKFILTRENLKRICDNDYAYKVLLIIDMVTEHNPALKIVFRK